MGGDNQINQIYCRRRSFLTGQPHLTYLWILLFYIFFHFVTLVDESLCIFLVPGSRTVDDQESPDEMAFLSAWIVSLYPLPFLFLICGKRIKCHCETIIAATAAFSSPIHVPAMQLRNKPWPHWCRSYSIGLEAYIHTHIHWYTQHSADQQKCFV